MMRSFHPHIAIDPWPDRRDMGQKYKRRRGMCPGDGIRVGHENEGFWRLPPSKCQIFMNLSSGLFKRTYVPCQQSQSLLSKYVRGGTASGRMLPLSGELKESLCKCAVVARLDDAVHDAVIFWIKCHNRTKQRRHAQQLCLSD